jgi:Tat protein secretion system quality control protein TatD with DNase activity
MIDTHIHFDSSRYRDYAAICARAVERGIEAMIVPGVSESSNLVVAIGRPLSNCSRCCRTPS